MCACINPHVEVLEHLISLKDDFNTRDTKGRKPVHYAACSSSPENIRVLIKNGVDTRDIDLFKKTPLMYAC
jgi:ankyrin repeat protein